MGPNRLKTIPIVSHLSDDEAKRLAAFATETTVADATGSDAASGTETQTRSPRRRWCV
jgi:hypothetical protein